MFPAPILPIFIYAPCMFATEQIQQPAYRPLKAKVPSSTASGGSAAAKVGTTFVQLR
jgi:hypothetical protein